MLAEVRKAIEFAPIVLLVLFSFNANQVGTFPITGWTTQWYSQVFSDPDIQDARATAAALGFPHYVVDESDAFHRAVIDDFVDQHRIGRTPNPCVRCNEKLKFWI